MATGFTHAIEEGETSFEKFALRCARAFGALISMRDDSLEKEIPTVFEPDLYHFGQIQRAEKELEEIQAMTLAEAQAEAEELARQENGRRSIALTKAEERRARYDAVLSQTKVWKPPTPDHEELKKFMIDQIESSVRFDCDDKALYELRAVVKPESAEEYLAARIETAKYRVRYHQQAWKEEQERAEGRTAWVQALLSSLASTKENT